MKPPHKTAQQRRAERPRKIRQIDTAALAPSMSLSPNRCECGHMALMHRPPRSAAQIGGRAECAARGCGCAEFAKETT